MNTQSGILIQACKYEDESTTLKLYPNNGLWSAYIRVYVNNKDLSELINQLKNYSGKKADVIDWSLGEPSKNYAYYFKFQCRASDSVGHGIIRVIIEYSDLYHGGKSADFVFPVIPCEVNNFGELLEQSMKDGNDEDVFWKCGNFV